MRKKSNLCPNCKGPTETSWKYCLACGEVLQEESIETAPDPRVVTAMQEKAYRKGKVKCWQCHAKLTVPSPACPSCGADLLNPRPTTRSVAIEEPGGALTNLPLPILLLFALMGAAVIGGMGFLMSSGDKSGASEEQSFQMPGLPSIDFSSLFRDDNVSATEIPIGIGVEAVEGRAISVEDDGRIIVRMDGHDFDVRLAGLSADFVNDCLGEKAIARIRRILSEGAEVWVYLDGVGRLSARSEADVQSVFIWQHDSGTGKIRFVNQEVINSGEAELQRTDLTGQPPAPELTAAAERAEEKDRGRFAEGACS